VASTAERVTRVRVLSARTLRQATLRAPVSATRDRGDCSISIIFRGVWRNNLRAASRNKFRGADVPRRRGSPSSLCPTVAFRSVPIPQTFVWAPSQRPRHQTHANRPPSDVPPTDTPRTLPPRALALLCSIHTVSVSVFTLSSTPGSPTTTTILRGTLPRKIARPSRNYSCDSERNRRTLNIPICTLPSALHPVRPGDEPHVRSHTHAARPPRPSASASYAKSHHTRHSKGIRFSFQDGDVRAGTIS
jgi:hypothetical protein